MSACCAVFLGVMTYRWYHGEWRMAGLEDGARDLVCAGPTPLRAKLSLICNRGCHRLHKQPVDFLPWYPGRITNSAY